MKLLNESHGAFFALVRAGLWENRMLHDSWFFDERSGRAERMIHDFSNIDWDEVFRLAEKQSVIGVVLAGIDWFKVHDSRFTIPQELLLQWIGEVQILEQQNKAMNKFISRMSDELNKNGIDAVLIKGQGVAQCYERPLWRCSGDVDLLLNEENYEKGKKYFARVSETAPEEYCFNKEYITTVNGWCLELHGSLRCGLSAALNRGVDAIQWEICNNRHVRYWDNDGKNIPLPEENDDTIVIFTHFIKHFYKGGLGIRQICDWCRLLWTYKETIDVALLEIRLHSMGLITEWRAFAAYAVDFLGMPVEAMPLYDVSSKWKRKAEKIQDFIVEVGNFGHNKDRSYFTKYPFMMRKTISMWRRICALSHHARIFPWNSTKYMPYVLYTGLWSAAKGE